MQPLLNLMIRLARPYWIRGKGRLLNHLVKSDSEVEEHIFGAKFLLDLKDHIQKNIYLGVFEPYETKAVGSFLKPGMTFLDVGANVGYFSALAASKVGNTGSVLSLEPSPYAYGRLERMVRESHLGQVRTFPFALGNQSGTARLALPPQGNHTPSLLSESGASFAEIEIRTLDECLADWQVDRVDLIKIDVEGFEARVLEGAKNALVSGRVGAILCEFNDHWLKAAGTSPEQLFDVITSHGFRCTSGRPKFVAGSVFNLLFLKDSGIHTP